MQNERPALPEGRSSVEIRPGLHRGRLALPSRLDHVNVWLLVDGGELAAVDTGAALDPTRGFWDAVLPGLPPLRRLLVTHHHHDHLGLAGWLCDRCGAELSMTRAEWLTAQLRRRAWSPAERAWRRRYFLQHGLEDGNAGAIEGRMSAFAATLEPLPASYRRLTDGDEVAAGGRIWRVLTGDGHAPEQAGFWCQDDGILIAGDLILPGITPHLGVWPDEPDANPLAGFLATLDRLAALPADTLVLPSHGDPFDDLHGRVAALRAHHERRLGQMLDVCASPRSAAAIMAAVFREPRDLGDVMLALTETVAHLNFLVAAGELVAGREAGGPQLFGLR